MSDFINEFWPWYVGAISLVSILACALLLWIAGKATVITQPGRPNDNTTGHVWDENLSELNNPLPRWWMWLFILTVIFSLAYLVFFPGLGSFKGTLNWSSTETEHKQDVSNLRVQVAPLYAAFTVQPIETLGEEEIRALAQYVLSLSGSPHDTIKAFNGKKLYATCAACHGIDGKGNKALGAPNLADDNWLYGWGEESIIKAIKNGKNNVMPAQATKLSPEQIHVVAAYVLSLSASSFPETIAPPVTPALPSKVP
jgi:cytochrome c oxidase cbb3-type subunit 3